MEQGDFCLDFNNIVATSKQRCVFAGMVLLFQTLDF